jgi:ferrous iron transport protein A
MTLAQSDLGRLLTVSRIGGERAFRRRLMELGLVPGTRIELKGVAPLGDPMELLVRGCSLSIRRAEAEQVEVVAVEAASERVAASDVTAASELDAQSVP